MTNQTLLILVDGSSYLYRAFHAMPTLSNSRGEPTGAIYGVVNMLRKLLADHPAEHVAVVFDAPGKTFRDDLFAQYKANRESMPEELRAQIEPLHAVIQALGIPLLCVPGVEADDVIGTLTKQAVQHGMHSLISTSDKDMAQLVNEQVALVNTMTDSYIDTQGVVDKFGVRAEQMVDYLTLIGDTSDNIPGVPSVGPKTAAKWLQNYGTLDNLVAHADEIKGKVGDSLRACLGQLPLSHQLATIHCNVALDIRAEDLRVAPPDVEKLKTLYQRLEFKTWLGELLSRNDAQHTSLTQDGNSTSADQTQAPNEIPGTDYQTILNAEQLAPWLNKLQHAELFAFDTETTGPDYMHAEIVGVSFAIQPHAAAYIPLAHDYPGAPAQLSCSDVLTSLRPLLEDPQKIKIGQNTKFDMSVLANYGITLRGTAFDTMLESYVLNSVSSRHDIDTLALKHLGHKTISFEEIAGKGAKQIALNQVTVDIASNYAAEEADITLRLHHKMWPLLEQDAKLKSLYESIEMPLVPVLSHIERTGVLVDAAMLNSQSIELGQSMNQLEHEAYRLAGEEFNLGSPKQIQEILYNKLKLPVLEKTPTGQPSTAESVLQELAANYQLPQCILNHRGMSKLKSTYTDRLPEQINPRTGRVHTSYHQAVASTGRLSSSDPNLQNIPIRSEEGRRIRQAFIAPPGYKIVAADYSQIELRILAHLSGDAGLLRAFSEGTDVHRATAAEVFGVPPDKVTNDQRRNAKAINFGLIYGMSAFGLARQLGIERGIAQEYIDLYFARYPGVKLFMDSTRASARQLGHVETVFGRRLYLPDIKASNAQRRQYAERTAINAPMQGTAADIIKRAMIGAYAWLQKSSIDARIIMQVHDELVFEVGEGILDQTIVDIRNHMSRAADLAVPLVVDIGIGNNWDEAH